VPDYTVRRATRDDIDTIVAFTRHEAREAEELELDVQAVTRGVRAAFDDPSLALYWIAESTSGQIAASTSIVTEWSNFRGGKYWWVQSLFVAPEHRGQGLVDRLLNHLVAEAQAAGALDVRLYAHESNERALRVYERCAFTRAPYVVMRRGLSAWSPSDHPVRE
jgi:ribosomal protein S18 acetylase RimI-like enzyme